MTAIAYPFLRAPEDCVLAAPWVLLENGTPVQTEDGLLAHFDYSTALSASRQISVDFPALAHALKIDVGMLTVRACIFIGTGSGRLDRSRSLGCSIDLTADRMVAPLEVVIGSRDVSGSLQLATELILTSTTGASSRLSPAKVGARLWSDSFRVDVEPAQPRFPMEAVSFSRMLGDGPTHALWYLDWSPSGWERDFAGAVRLYLNEDDAEFVEAVHEADETVIRLIMSAIALQLIRTALASESFRPESGAYPAGSVGAVVEDLIDQAFPGQEIQAVSTLALHDPARFEAAVASMTFEVDSDE